MIEKNKIRLLFTGDLIPPIDKEGAIYSQELLNLLRDKDFSITNLETPLTDSNVSITKTGRNFKRSPSSIKFIKEGHFDAVCLSNNHIRDYDDQGVVDTIDTCHKNNIKTVGAGKNLSEAKLPLHLNIKGKQISILNYSEKEFNIADNGKAGANPFDLIDAYNDVKREREKNDYVIVVYHGGLEYHHLPYPYIVKYFRFLIDIGVDCIISHHTHRYSGYEYYREKPILYGLGNFLSSTKAKFSDEWLTGIIAQLYITKKGLSFKTYFTKMNSNFTKVYLLNNEESVNCE